jgi:UDP:flavonoid glycosyltransferase YjiC (YdhE family)
MMRAMFDSAGNDGHLRPMLPLALQLRANCHDVTFVVPNAHRDAVAHIGFDVVGVDTPDMGDPDLIADVIAAPPSERPLRALAGFADMAVVVAEAISALPIARRPDLLVRETSAWGAWLAGELLDVPVATFDYCPLPAGAWDAIAGDLLHSARSRVGLPPEPGLASLDRWLTIVGAPRSWFAPECFRATTHLFQPPEDLAETGVTPEWLDALPRERPTVYVTLGTVFNQTPGVFELIFEAVADRPMNVIATVGRSVDPQRFGPLPTNVRVERFVPQGIVLDRCDAVIAHGGYGSLMGALRRGLPIVSLPLAAGDNLANALRLEQLGAGIAITERRRSASAVSDALLAVLTEPSYRAAAERLRTEIDELPPLTSAVSLLERLAEDRERLALQ